MQAVKIVCAVSYSLQLAAVMIQRKPENCLSPDSARCNAEVIHEGKQYKDLIAEWYDAVVLVITLVHSRL